MCVAINCFLLPHYYHAITTVLPQYYHYSQVHNVSSMLQQTFCPQLTTTRKSHQANVPRLCPTLPKALGTCAQNYRLIVLMYVGIKYKNASTRASVPDIDNSDFFLSLVDSFHQFIWCKYLHLGETKPLLAQVLYGCSYVIHIIVYTKEAVM